MPGSSLSFSSLSSPSDTDMDGSLAKSTVTDDTPEDAAANDASDAVRVAAQRALADEDEDASEEEEEEEDGRED